MRPVVQLRKGFLKIFQDALRTCEAVAEDETLTIATGKFVLVTGNISEVLVVRPLSVSDAVKTEEE